MSTEPILSSAICFTSDKVDLQYDYTAVAKELHGLEKGAEVQTVLEKYGVNCRASYDILHELGVVPALFDVKEHTKRLKAQWGSEGLET